MDRVQVIIRESSATGGNGSEEEDLPRPIMPQEDAPEVAGIFVQSATARDQTVYVTRDVANNLISKDQTVTNTVRLVDEVFVRMQQDADITIPATFTWVRHDLMINDGITVTIQDGAELLLI